MIRLLSPSDVEACLGLSHEAGWNQTAGDWLAALQMGPESCWGFEDAGAVVGTATVVDYAGALAWIGMVLVRGDRRRRGIARRLMQHALDWCDARRIKTVKLDATDLGRPLYLALGFEDEQPIERWAGVGQPGEFGVQQRPDFDVDDFGPDRRALLRLLMDVEGAESFASPKGFLLTRPGANARFIGPLVAEEGDTARRLVQQALAAHPGEPHFWDLLPEHPEAATLAEELGFSRRRRLIRMAKPLDQRRSESPRLWGTAGFEYG